MAAGAPVGQPAVLQPRPASGAERVASLVEAFVDNRRRRQETIDAHIDEVEDCLQQGDPLKFAFWSLDRDASFFQSSDQLGPKMLEVLGKDIGLTTEQLARLNAHKPAIRRDRETLARCQEQLRQARQTIHQHIGHSAAIMEQIRKILSPVQVAKFFVWVEKHQKSVETLTTLWDGPAAEANDSEAAMEGAETEAGSPASGTPAPEASTDPTAPAAAADHAAADPAAPAASAASAEQPPAKAAGPPADATLGQASDQASASASAPAAGKGTEAAGRTESETTQTQ